MSQTLLNDLLSRFVTDLGATMAAGNVLVGDRLGLYRALAAAGPSTPAELAAATATAERGYVSYDSSSGRFRLDEAQTLAFADPGGFQLPGAFQFALASLAAQDEITHAFRSGQGVAWGDHDPGVFTGCERFFRPGYAANLVESWIPAVDGLDARLRAGIAVADVGCGLGPSTRILAATYPQSAVAGFDSHDLSVQLARAAAADDGLAERVSFATASAYDFPGSDYGLVATFDCLHDMGDPVTAALRIRDALAADGVWLIVEPYAGASLADNLTPVGRLYYSFSTFLCVPHARSEGAVDPLGNQAGEAGVRAVVDAAGFAELTRVAETPFNIVYAARP